jgi:predicted phosphodiesterase
VTELQGADPPVLLRFAQVLPRNFFVEILGNLDDDLKSLCWTGSKAMLSCKRNEGRPRMQYQRVFCISLLGFAACGNVSGHISSTKTGDTSRPAERRSPIEQVRAACGGDGTPTTYGADTIKRAQYLQQVTGTGAMFGWVSTQPVGERVSIMKPPSAMLMKAPAAVEDYTLRSAGENQLWSPIEQLEPSTIYCYQLEDEMQALTTPTGFKTAPSPESTEPVRFLAFGDSGGGGSDQYALLEQMYTVPYDLMIHTGDIAYDDGTIAQYEDNVFGVYADLFKNIPFMPASGNHDYRTMQGAPFRDVFNLPAANGEKWYSYDWGRVHFVALDTEADYSAQAAWLEQDLAASNLPWKIIYMHKPMYSSGMHGSDTTLRNKIAPVAEKYGVQLILAGHDHNYERIKPQNGVAYVVTGGGGIGTRSVGSSSFTALAEDVIHFVYVEVGVDELVLHAIDATGREFDSMAVPRA